ncbi:MAG: helix-turn-helix domain-containing protein [Firmicutes bacterium]|nr:helix-turn-helix domain-containing protein [Bacillota bacterium]
MRRQEATGVSSKSRPPRQELFTVKEVSAITRLSLPTIYRAIEKGEIPALKIGRSRRIPRWWVEAQTRPPSS